MVRPGIEYASTVWDPTCKEDIKALEQVQSRASRFVFNNYTDRTQGCVTGMIDRLKWGTFENRRTKNRFIMPYRIKNNLVYLEPTTYFKQSDSRTRGSQGLFQEHTNHLSLHNSFFPRTIRQWNSLPMNLKILLHWLGLGTTKTQDQLY